MGDKESSSILMRFDLRIIVAFLLCIYAMIPTILGAEPVFVTEELEELNITANLEYVVDPESRFAFDEIRTSKGVKWLSSTEPYIGFGYVKDSIWVRFTITNTTESTRKFVLEELFLYTDYFDVYIPRIDSSYKTIRTGAALPFYFRPLNHRTLAFDLSLLAGQSKTYYLRYETTDNLIISLKVRSHKNFDDYRIDENMFMWLYYGAMLIMFAYNLFLLFAIRDLSYLFYIMYLVGLFHMGFIFNGHGYQHLWPDQPVLNRLFMPIPSCVMVASLLLFVRSFIETWKYNKIFDRLLLGMVFFTIFYALLFFVTPYWRITIQAMSPILAAEGLILVALLFYYAFRLKLRTAYLLLLALFVMFIGGLLFALKVAQILPNNNLTTYGVQVGSLIDVTVLSFALADKINYMRKMRDKAENKYRHLVESANEIIFTLDEENKFLTVNAAFQQYLGFLPENIIGKHFSDFIYEIKGERNHYSRNIAQEYLNIIRTEKQTTTFKTNLKGLYNLEPGPFNVRLQYLELNDGIEILGRASPDMEDALFDDIRAEAQSYEMSNFFSNADLISHRLTKYIEKFMGIAEVLCLRLALREILINSIEHGNLGVSFEDKSAALERMDYFEVLRKRQNDPKNVDKKTQIEYSLTADRIAVRVTDAGLGFDHQLFFSTAEKNAREGHLLHGRGLLMCMDEFDYMNFNEKGNSITVVKYLSERREAPEVIFPG